MKQYNTIKAKYPDAMLLFRVGDFYETFGEDAVRASRILDIVLTKRANGSDNSALAGFPHHSLETYLGFSFIILSLVKRKICLFPIYRIEIGR